MICLGLGPVVYAIAEPYGDIRYVGFSRHLYARWMSHKCARTPLGNWIRQSAAKPIVLERLPHTTLNFFARERVWIELFRSSGADLFNKMPRKA